MVLRQSDLWTLTSFGNTFSCKQRRVIFAWAGWLIWQHLLLKITMTHPLFNLRIRTLTINSGDVPPLKHVRARTPQLSIKLCLDMTSFGNVLLLFIAMTHAGCGLKLCSVTKNSDDIYRRACLGRTPPLNMFGHVPPPPTCQSNPI